MGSSKKAFDPDDYILVHPCQDEQPGIPEISSEIGFIASDGEMTELYSFHTELSCMENNGTRNGSFNDFEKLCVKNGKEFVHDEPNDNILEQSFIHSENGTSDKGTNGGHVDSSSKMISSVCRNAFIGESDDNISKKSYHDYEEISDIFADKYLTCKYTNGPIVAVKTIEDELAEDVFINTCKVQLSDPYNDDSISEDDNFLIGPNQRNGKGEDGSFSCHNWRYCLPCFNKRRRQHATQ